VDFSVESVLELAAFWSCRLSPGCRATLKERRDREGRKWEVRIRVESSARIDDERGKKEGRSKK